MWINSNKRVSHCMVQYVLLFCIVANFFIILLIKIKMNPYLIIGYMYRPTELD
jgi:hypothetical protein